jgi:hypothetical protein
VKGEYKPADELAAKSQQSINAITEGAIENGGTYSSKSGTTPQESATDAQGEGSQAGGAGSAPAIAERWLAAVPLASGRALSSKRVSQPATIPSLVRAYLTRRRHRFTKVGVSAHPPPQPLFRHARRCRRLTVETTFPKLLEDHLPSPIEIRFHGGTLP